MTAELYTIDITITTDLEKFQALRIDALERELIKHKEFLKEICQDIENHANQIEVNNPEIL